MAIASTTSGLNGMLKHRNVTIERIEKYMQRGQFSDVNLTSMLWTVKDESAVLLTMYSVPGFARIPFADAIKGNYAPVSRGVKFGPTWTTHWVRLVATVPTSMDGARIVLLFDPGCEAFVWSAAGEPLMGITGGDGGDRHVDMLVAAVAAAGEQYEFYIEVAANGMFGAGKNGGINPPDPEKYYTLETAEIAVPNKTAHSIWWDLEVFVGMAKELPINSQGAADALYTANKIVNAIRHDRPETLIGARAIGTEFFATRAKQGYESHVITAVGNCHIDTAWLWPYDETKRKSARSWATQCRHIEMYPHYTFAASQAQQFEWTEQLYPELFSCIKRHVATGNFIPIGGTWVEMDCNVPSGESFCRQFLYGQRYFESRFGQRCSVFWLPDTFGYSAQLPQIVKQSGLEYFFTQKLSWNLINKFPHTTFMWTGLDGTSVLTHFCPADTYTAGATVKDIVHSVSNHKDKEYSNKCLLLYGNGDGGGGPLIPMIERLNRMRSVESLPASVKFGDPNAFYRDLEATSRDLPIWRGELYFELHRGTYTSQAMTKKYNRSTELLLRQVEILDAIHLALGTNHVTSKEELDRLWKLVLLNQFHDVLPGSSIGMVYTDAIKFYEDVTVSGRKLSQSAMDSLVSVASNSSRKDTRVGLNVFNLTSWRRSSECIEIDLNVARTMSGFDAASSAGKVQISADKTKAVMMIGGLGPMSHTIVTSVQEIVNGAESLANAAQVTATTEEDGSIVIDNGILRACFDKHGRLTSLVYVATGRELVPPGQFGNVFKYFEDIPLYWDAWDVEVYHLEKGWEADTGTIRVVESGPVRVVLRVAHALSPTSTLEQTIVLCADSHQIVFDTDVFWNENRRILKVEFPWAITSDVATYETQFGVLQRPTHYNTSWDMARFEVCGHKFVDLSEYGFGVSLLNDCKYGFSVHGGVMRMSLLRAPKAPDDACDIGRHSFKYAVRPHVGTFAESDVVRAGYEFNVPLLHRSAPVSASNGSSRSFFELDAPNVVLDTIKVAEGAQRGTIGGKNRRRVVLRLYEAYGGRGVVHVRSNAVIEAACLGNILEDVGESIDVTGDGHVIAVTYTPFQVITVLVDL